MIKECGGVSREPKAQAFGDVLARSQYAFEQLTLLFFEAKMGTPRIRVFKGQVLAGS